MSKSILVIDTPKSCSECELKCILLSKNSDRIDMVHPNCPLQNTIEPYILSQFEDKYNLYSSGVWFEIRKALGGKQ